MTARPSPTPAMQAFQIRPTPPALGSGPADELMIDWSGLPQDTRAVVYLPAADADDILASAAARYVSHPFTRLDAHTLGCAAAGTTTCRFRSAAAPTTLDSSPSPCRPQPSKARPTR